MYFLLTLMAAVISTLICLGCSRRKQLKLGSLCLIYWGASIMWAVDLFVAGVIEGEGISAFETGMSATVLGVLVVALGAAIWAGIYGVSRIRSSAEAN